MGTELRSWISSSPSPSGWLLFCSRTNTAAKDHAWRKLSTMLRDHGVLISPTSACYKMLLPLADTLKPCRSVEAKD